MVFENSFDLGKLGEYKFSEWCATAQLTSNRSTDEDKNGWDHLVEFPYIETSLPRDKQRSPIECKVQIKSTQRNSRSVGIKISVLKRLIDYSYPAFILFLHFSKDCEPSVESAFLVHVDAEMIEKVLKKIRINDSLNNPKKLYNIKLTVNYNAGHKIFPPSGLEFRNKVLSFIPNNDVYEYQIKKYRIVQAIGYESKGYIVKFNVSPEKFERYITERVIGLTESITIANSVILDNRFNQGNSSFEILSSENALVTLIPKVSEKCDLIFKIDQYSPSVLFNAEIIFTPSFTFGWNKFFIKCQLFVVELLYSPAGEVKANFHLTENKSAELDEVIRIMRIFDMASKIESLYVELKIKSNEILQLKVGIKHGFPNTESLVESLEELKRIYQLDGKVITTIDEIYSKREVIGALNGLIKKDFTGFEVVVNDNQKNSIDDKVLPFTAAFSLGSVAIGIVSLLQMQVKEGEIFNVVNTEILKLLFFNDGMPDRSVLAELEKQELTTRMYKYKNSD